jgi:hypothetical protein
MEGLYIGIAMGWYGGLYIVILKAGMEAMI